MGFPSPPMGPRARRARAGRFKIALATGGARALGVFREGDSSAPRGKKPRWESKFRACFESELFPSEPSALAARVCARMRRHFVPAFAW
eukprot:4705123-Pyramimonas_sp.AAC.1